MAKYEKYDKSGNFVICQECGKQYKVISPTHLTTHNMTFGEYQLKYPDCPTTSQSFQASLESKQRESVLFKDKENLPKETIEIEKPEEPKKKSFELANDQKNKQDILNYLVNYFPFIENNHVIEKTNIQGHLEYKFTVDIADPVRKTIFDFPNAYWHNTELYPDHSRNMKLKEDKWIIITIKSHYPTIVDIQEYMDNITG